MSHSFKIDSESEPIKIVVNAEQFKKYLDEQPMESIFLRTDSYLPDMDAYLIYKEKDEDKYALIEAIKAVKARDIERFLILKDRKIIPGKGKNILVLSKNDVLRMVKAKMKKKFPNFKLEQYS